MSQIKNLKIENSLIFSKITNYEDINIFILLCVFNFVNNNLYNKNFFYEIEKYKGFYFTDENLNAKQKKYNKKFYNTIKYFYYENDIISKIINNIYNENIKNSLDSTNNYSLVLTKIFNYNNVKKNINEYIEKLKITINENNISEFNTIIYDIETYIININIIDMFNIKKTYNIHHLIHIIFNYNISCYENISNKLEYQEKYEEKTLQLICVQQNDTSIFYYYYKNINDNKWFFSNNFNNINFEIGNNFNDVIIHDENLNKNYKIYNLFYFNLR